MPARFLTTQAAYLKFETKLTTPPIFGCDLAQPGRKSNAIPNFNCKPSGNAQRKSMKGHVYCCLSNCKTLHRDWRAISGRLDLSHKAYDVYVCICIKGSLYYCVYFIDAFHLNLYLSSAVCIHHILF